MFKAFNNILMIHGHDVSFWKIRVGIYELISSIIARWSNIME